MPETTLPYDHIYMSRCLQLARCGLFTARPNPMVGAVLVLPDEGKDSGEGRIVGEGYHVRYGEGHAEVNCFASMKPLAQMLVHKLRAEEDCILVGRVTDEREHPQLTVRHWHGPDPERIVVDRNHPLRLDVLHAHGIQSLIVEGGAKTLNRFIGENLWDEMRVETSPLYVGGGTRAPEIPPSAQLCEQQCFDGNDIRLYCNRSLD